MFVKNGWRVLITVAIMAILIVNPAAAESLYTRGPNFSLSFSPGGGAQVGQDVNIHIKVDSANPGATKINVGCGGVSKGETSEVEFDSTWHTNGCSGGNANVNVCTKAADDPNWQDPNCNDFGYSLSSAPSNDPPPQDDTQISCEIDSFDVWPRNATVGDNIHISGSGHCNANINVRAARVNLDGNNLYEIGSPSLEWDWNTSGYSAGQHTLNLWVTGQGDNDWGYTAISENITVQLNASNQQAPGQDQSTPFNNCGVISLNDGRIFVVTTGSGLQKHHIPNPETLDALGIPRAWIDNKGWSNSELKSIHTGSDIPDINRDASGFAAFKAQCFPNTTPITSSEGIPNEYPVEPEQGPGGNDSNGCPIAEARLWEGGDAVLSRTDMNMRKGPGVDNEIVKIVHQGSQIKVSGESACSGGSRWIKVSFGGDTGWISEVNSSGEYYLSPIGNNPEQQPQAQDQQDQSPQDEPELNTTRIMSTCSQLPDNRTLLDKLLGVRSANAETVQCTQYVYSKAEDVIKRCIGTDYPDAGNWDTWAAEEIKKNGNPCSITIEPLLQNNSTVKEGDVIVWNGYDANKGGSSCSGALEPGHVAFFSKWQQDGFKMDGENWKGDIGKVDPKCMSVIHITNDSNPQEEQQQIPIPQEQNQATDKCNQYKWFRWVWCKVSGK